jgi:hypothetical protein
MMNADGMKNLVVAVMATGIVTVFRLPWKAEEGAAAIAR